MLDLLWRHCGFLEHLTNPSHVSMGVLNMKHPSSVRLGALCITTFSLCVSKIFKCLSPSHKLNLPSLTGGPPNPSSLLSPFYQSPCTLPPSTMSLKARNVPAQPNLTGRL